MRPWLLRLSALAFLFGLLSVVRPSPASACWFETPPPAPREAFELTDAVFIGYLVSVEHLPAWGAVLTFEASHVWKGPVAETLYVVSGPPCDYPLEERRTYIVYAYVRHDTYRVWFGRTAFVLHAQEDLESLGKGQVPEPGTVGPYPWTGEIRRMVEATEDPGNDARPASAADQPEPVPSPEVSPSESGKEGGATPPPWAIGLMATALALVGGAGFVALRHRARRT